MINLKTNYLGIELKNPIIVGANNLVSKIENLQKMEEAGAAAIVIRSLFEEQIQLENLQMEEEMGEHADSHAEATSMFPTLDHAGPREHLMMVKQAKNAVNIPVIASLNAIFKETWIEYAKLLEDCGVDGIEMNFYAVPKESDLTGEEIEKEQIEILNQVKSSLSIPVSVKLSPFYANPLNVISRMDKTGVDGFVLFNKYFQPEIDLDNEKHIVDFQVSTPGEGKLSLRFAGLLHGNVKGSICANTGIHSGADVAKMLLVGADCVQVVGTLYKNNIEVISTMLKDLEGWMKSKNYNSLKDFKGKLSNNSINDPFVYKRAQYVDLLLKSEEIFKKEGLM